MADRYYALLEKPETLPTDGSPVTVTASLHFVPDGTSAPFDLFADPANYLVFGWVASADAPEAVSGPTYEITYEDASANFAASEWTSLYGPTLVVPQGGTAPSLSGDLLTFDGTTETLAAALGGKATPTKHALPDASGGAVGEGFTITGLSRLPNGNWVCANFGRPDEDSTDPHETSVVILSSDFSTIVAEYLAEDDLGLDPGTIQGVTVDNGGMIWARISNNLVRIDPADGTVLNIVAVAATPNGLAWDSLLDQPIVYDTVGNVHWVDVENGGYSGSFAIPGSDPDMIHFLPDVGAEGTLIVSRGSSGAAGIVFTVDVALQTKSTEMTLPAALAIEGVYFDYAENLLYVANDGYFHNGTSGENCVYAYPMIEPLGTRFAAYWQGRVLSAPAGGTACAIAWDATDASDVQAGVYVPSGSTTALRVYMRTPLGLFNSGDLTVGDLTVAGFWWVDINTAGTVTVYKDGAQVATGTMVSGGNPPASTVPSGFTPWLRVASVEDFSTGDPTRVLAMEIEGFGILQDMTREAEIRAKFA